MPHALLIGDKLPEDVLGEKWHVQTKRLPEGYLSPRIIRISHSRRYFFVLYGRILKKPSTHPSTGIGKN